MGNHKYIPTPKKVYLFGKGQSLARFNKEEATKHDCYFINDSIFWGIDIDAASKTIITTDNIDELDEIFNELPENVDILSNQKPKNKQEYTQLPEYGWGICTANAAMNYFASIGVQEVVAVGFDGMGESLIFHKTIEKLEKEQNEKDPNHRIHQDWHYGRYAATMACQAHYLGIKLTMK
jgi:hypothetical protein